VTRDDASLAPGPLAAYCSYAIPLTALPAVVMNLVPPFYSERFGLPLATIGSTFLALRLFDAVTDPAMGWLIDRRPFRRQHKPWIVGTLPLLLLGLGLLFFPVTSSGGAVYLLAAGLVVYAAYTMGSVTHQAWGGALARTPEALSRLFGFREIAVIIGIMGGFVAPAIAELLGYSGVTSKVTAASLFIALSLFVFTTLAARLAPDGAARERSAPANLSAIGNLIRRREFVLIAVAILAQNFGIVGFTVVSYFLAEHVFGEADRYALSLSLHFVTAGIGMAVWMPLARRIGEARTLAIGAAYVTVVMLSLPLWVEHGTFLGFMALIGFAFGGPPFLMRAMIGSMAHRHEARTGQSVLGTGYAAANFFDKLGSGVAAGIVLPLVARLGFNPELDVTSEGLSALVSVATVGPGAGFLVLTTMAILLRRVERGEASERRRTP